MGNPDVFVWDPTKDHEDDNLTHTARSRIQRDLMNLYTDSPPGIFVIGDEKNIKFIHALIIGPMDTPYDGGLFYFILKCPNNYPIQPPRVKLLTTDAGRVRFNPNLYKSGMVCVSILGTFSGPEWSPAQQLSSLLITIQSLMTEKPYYNEPGFTNELVPGDSDRYNEIITYQTLRVAVCGMVENECSLNIPKQLQGIINKSFLNYFDQYLHVVEEKMHTTGRVIANPFTGSPVTIDYATIKKRLLNAHKKLSTAENEEEPGEPSD